MSYDSLNHKRKGFAHDAMHGGGTYAKPDKPEPAFSDMRRKRCPGEGCNKPITAKQLTQYGKCPACMKKERDRETHPENAA